VPCDALMKMMMLFSCFTDKAAGVVFPAGLKVGCMMKRFATNSLPPTFHASCFTVF